MKSFGRPSAKWSIAGMLLSNFVIFLFFLWDFLYRLGFLPWRLVTLSKYGWLTVSVLFIAVGLICYLVPNYFTYEDGTPLFPDQTRWQRRTLIGGWGGIILYTVLEVILVKANPESFLTAQIELFPLVFTGSFCFDICRSLLLIRRLRRDAEEAVFKG